MIRMTRARAQAIRDEHGGPGPLAWCAKCKRWSPCETRTLANLAIAALRPTRVEDKGLTR